MKRACSGKHCLIKVLLKKQRLAKGSKNQNYVTILFFVNGKRVSECPPVFGKGKNKAELPVWYYSQKKSWMDGGILNSVLGRINGKLVRSGRKILLFMDNAGCHPADLTQKYSNIKVVFLPQNTTPKLQPLDLGIIKTFKTHYRKLFLRYVLTKLSQCF